MCDKSLKSILIEHYKKYPLMRIHDMVKLIFQNEFAGGHMIPDEDKSLISLRKEIESLRAYMVKLDEDSFVEIGNGYCRLSLRAIENTGIAIETVNRFFVNTANNGKGSIESFEEKLDVFRLCCKNGELDYSPDEVEAYLPGYKKQGYPPVSHSDEYRSAYCPSYRVIDSQYRKFFNVFLKIDSLLKSRNRVIVAIDGKCGAGKTTLASLLSSVYDCNTFHMDNYFLPPELRTDERLSEAGGNVDYVRFRQEVIEGIQSEKPFKFNIYDCSVKKLREGISVAPKKLSIIEGSYSMHPTLQESYDLKVFLNIGENEQSERILKRNGEILHKRFVNEWIPMENRYFQEMRIKEQCDLVF